MSKINLTPDELAALDKAYEERLKTSVQAFIQNSPTLNPVNFGLLGNTDWQYFYGATQALRLLLRRYFSTHGEDPNTVELLEDGRIFYAGEEYASEGTAGEVAIFTDLLKSEPGYEVIDQKLCRKPIKFKNGGKEMALKLIRWIVQALLLHPRFFRNFKARASLRDNMKSVILRYIPRDESFGDSNIDWLMTKKSKV